MKKKTLSILTKIKFKNLLTKTKTMRKAILTLLLLSSVLSFASEVSGKIFLDNTSDHNGITIKFNPVSLSTDYVEGTSNFNGEYRINVTNGTYNISFEKNGYQTITLENQFINADVAIEDITLNSNGVFNVSGNVSGYWNKTNTYIVKGNINIPKGESLVIEAGTEIKFDGYYSLTVHGTINAIGNEIDYIKFTSNKTSPSNKDWHQILINESSTLSKLKYCIIEYGNKDNDANNGIIHVLGALDIENCIIRNIEEAGISIRKNADVSILNNEITNCSYGISANSTGLVIINNNKLSSINAIGVTVGLNSDKIVVSNNQISDCGVYGVQSWSDIVINNNLVFDVKGYGVMIVGGKPMIRNNTILSNGSGIGIYSSNHFKPNPIINSNIIINNNNFGIKSEGEPMPSLVSYNLFHNNGSGVGNNLPIGVTQLVTTNKNGTEADTYFNIFSAPNLMSINPNDANFCELENNSLAINAGDPNFVNTSNESIVDIGAKETTVVLSTNKFVKNIFKTFPNPITDNFIIQTNGNQYFDEINIYDIRGKSVKTYKLKTMFREYKVNDLNTLESGIYFIQLQLESGKIEMKKIIKN